MRGDFRLAFLPHLFLSRLNYRLRVTAVNDLHTMIKTAVENPHESTPIGMLADYLDEQHPQSRDPRAELLRRSMDFPVHGLEPEPAPRISGLTSPLAPQFKAKEVYWRSEEDPALHRGFGDTLDAISGYNANDYEHSTVEEGKRWATIHTQLSLDPNGRDRDPFVKVTLSHPHSRKVVKTAFRIRHKQARYLADRLTNGREFHDFLDQHFGPDPRKSTEKFARDYSHALNRKS